MSASRETGSTCCVDALAGWDVERGDVNGDSIKPSMLVSLTAPKLVAKHFSGAHWLGGRFVPPGIKVRSALFTDCLFRDGHEPACVPLKILQEQPG